MDWTSPVSELKGVGAQREAKLNRLGIYTIEDLLGHYPREYKDRSQLQKIAELELNEEQTFLAQIKNTGENYKQGRFVITRFRAKDESGEIGLLWYNQAYLKNTFQVGQWYLFTGKLQNKYSKKEVFVSEWEKIGDNFAGGRIIPIYPSVEGLSQKMLRNMIEDTLAQMKLNQQDTFPMWLRKEYNLAERNFSVEQIHFPKTEKAFYDARRRLVFEEFFILQGAMRYIKNQMETKGSGIPLKKKKPLNEFFDLLPFTMTRAQKRVVREIEKDITKGQQLNRLVQGDVGSGKTAVAMAACYWAIQNGYQAVMMAPTEVLASQHYASFQAMFAPLGIETVLLSGSLRAKEKREVLGKIQNGEAGMIVGTHAVIQDTVTFHKLALAITDEQHRFGVKQRGILSEKGEKVHTLVMTATPIPRTLAIILYGDLDISIIDELPPGRQKIDTIAVPSSYHERIYSFIQKEVQAGRQAYVICPMIEENEKLELQSVLAYTEELTGQLPSCRVACVHGKMKAKEKQEIMEQFANGELDVLVSTTVIEVGINVPNSTIMLIENAERFGLAQLHQLRGRVGRGAEKSYCIMVSDAKTKLAKERLKALVESEDGFVISEMDLKLRGPGEFFGTRQHGLPELKIANIYKDMPTLLEAQQAVVDLFKKDKTMDLEEHELLKEKLMKALEGKTLDI